MKHQQTNQHHFAFLQFTFLGKRIFCHLFLNIIYFQESEVGCYLRQGVCDVCHVVIQVQRSPCQIHTIQSCQQCAPVSVGGSWTIIAIIQQDKYHHQLKSSTIYTLLKIIILYHQLFVSIMNKGQNPSKIHATKLPSIL